MIKVKESIESLNISDQLSKSFKAKYDRLDELYAMFE